MSETSSRPAYASSSRENGKTGTQQHNRDKLGSKSGPMGKEDQRKDKYGSRHNQDAQGLQSDETAQAMKWQRFARDSATRSGAAPEVGSDSLAAPTLHSPSWPDGNGP